MADLDRLVGELRCRDVLELLPDFVDGELSAEVLGRVGEHLRGCDTCEKFGGEYAALVSQLRAGRPRGELERGARDRLTERMARLWAQGDPGEPGQAR